MNEDQFSAMLAIIVPPIIEQITKNSNVDDDKAISHFGCSRYMVKLTVYKNFITSHFKHKMPMISLVQRPEQRSPPQHKEH